MNSSTPPLPRRVYPSKEGTRDPIFLLQVKRRVLIGYPDFLGHDGECFWLEDSDHYNVPDWMKEQDKSDDGLDDEAVEKFLDSYDLTGAGTCFLEHWDTERVLFTREEAEGWAAARSYRWKDGWRVYCICAEGQLSEILKGQTDEENSDEGFHVLSLKWTKRGDKCATFYRANSNGYAHSPDDFGVYTAEDVSNRLKRLNNGLETLAIPVGEVRKRVCTESFVKPADLHEFIEAKKKESTA